MTIVLAKAEANASLPMSAESHQLKVLHYPVITAAAEALVGLTWLVAVVVDRLYLVLAAVETRVAIRRLTLKTVLRCLLLLPMACRACLPTVAIFQ